MSLAFAGVLLLTASAGADLAPTVSVGALSVGTAMLGPSAAQQAQDHGEVTLPDVSGSDLLSYIEPLESEGHAARDGLTEQARATVVHELPASPSSAALFLSAMVSLGGWHLVRSARHLHLTALPEWYHTGGPVQVGHATPFDLDGINLPLCCFEQPAQQRPLCCEIAPTDEWSGDPQYVVPTAAPRGPPSGLSL